MLQRNKKMNQAEISAIYAFPSLAISPEFKKYVASQAIGIVNKTEGEVALLAAVATAAICSEMHYNSAINAGTVAAATS